MCLDFFRKKETIIIVEKVKDIPNDNVIMPSNTETAKEYLDKLRNVETTTKKPTKEEAFYIVQKAGGAWDSICMKCGDTPYQKLVPKPEGEYQYAYNGWLIKYEIKYHIVKDDEGFIAKIPEIHIMNIF